MFCLDFLRAKSILFFKILYLNLIYKMFENNYDFVHVRK